MFVGPGDLGRVGGSGGFNRFLVKGGGRGRGATGVLLLLLLLLLLGRPGSCCSFSSSFSRPPSSTTFSFLLLLYVLCCRSFELPLQYDSPNQQHSIQTYMV